MHELFQFDFSFGLFVVVTFQLAFYGEFLYGQLAVKWLGRERKKEKLCKPQPLSLPNVKQSLHLKLYFCDDKKIL